MRRAGGVLRRSVLVVVIAVASAASVALITHLVGRSGRAGDKDVRGSDQEGSSTRHLVEMEPAEVPQNQRDAYIGAKLDQFRSLPKDQCAEQIWELWKTIRYDDTQWSDWIDYEDRLFNALSETEEAGMAILLEQFHGDSGHLVLDACTHLGDFGLEAMHRVLGILGNGTELEKSLALSALRDSFAFEDLPDEERSRMRKAVEAVVSDESEALREQANEILRILDWNERQLEPRDAEGK